MKRLLMPAAIHGVSRLPVQAAFAIAGRFDSTIRVKLYQTAIDDQAVDPMSWGLTHYASQEGAFTQDVERATAVINARVEELGPGEGDAKPVAAGAQSLEVRVEAAKQKDRSAISRWVVAAFLLLVAFLLLYMLIGAVVYGWDAIKAPAEHAGTVVGTILLPVVTLVLGYYFGTSDRAA